MGTFIRLITQWTSISEPGIYTQSLLNKMDQRLDSTRTAKDVSYSLGRTGFAKTRQSLEKPDPWVFRVDFPGFPDESVLSTTDPVPYTFNPSRGPKRRLFGLFGFFIFGSTIHFKREGLLGQN